MHKYMPLMKPMTSTIQQGALYTFVTYITEQICLPHSKYSSMANILNGHIYRLNIFIYICHHNQLQIILHVIAKYMSETNMPTKLYIYAK